MSNAAFGLYDAALWNLALIASRLHLVWIATVCGKLETRYRYSNTLGWNTFPVPTLTDKNKADLTRCAEDILLAREAHFPATIADLYDPEAMPANLRAAHDRNDETLERIYIGRRFKNDTERLEKLFELYTKMTAPRTGGKEEPGKGAEASAPRSPEFCDADMGDFEWDEDKNLINKRKHGVSFEEAATIFDGPVLSLEDEGDYDEVRERSYGLIGGVVVAYVIHTDRKGTTRIISARKATANERKHFHAYLKRATR